MVLAIIFLMIKNRRSQTDEQTQEGKFGDKTKKDKLKDFLNSLKDDMEEEDEDDQPIRKKPLKQHPVLAVPKAKTLERAPDAYHQKSTIEDRRLKSSIEERKFQTSIEDRQLRTNIESRYDDPYGKRTKVLNLASQADAPSYDVIGKAGNSISSDIISNLKSKKKMVILHEIISPPKSMKD